MPNKLDLVPWLEDALRALGGRGTIAQICKKIWESHEADLRASGDLFFTWQYDVRWAANELRRKKVMKANEISPKGLWELA